MSLSIGIVGSAQRRQVHAVHGPHEQGRPRGQLPVRHHRAQRGRGPRARRAPGRPGRTSTIPARIVPATVEFVDIAGLVAGASQGEGLGNQFLANIRETDAICEVVRFFGDPDVVHVAGRVPTRAPTWTPSRPSSSWPTWPRIEKALPRLEKEAKRDKDGRQEARGGEEGARGPGRRPPRPHPGPGRRTSRRPSTICTCSR